MLRYLPPFIAILLAPLWLGLGAASARTPAKLAPRSTPDAAHSVAMAPVQVDLSPAGPSTARGLDLAVSNAATADEEITVYGGRPRPHPVESAGAARPVVLGGVTFTSALDTSRPGFETLTITASMPIGGVRGLDAVANVQEVRGTSYLGEAPLPSKPAGPPLGIRLSF
jgi:hypothetical protein